MVYYNPIEVSLRRHRRRNRFYRCICHWLLHLCFGGYSEQRSYPSD